jgi:hypothetical protein
MRAFLILLAFAAAPHAAAQQAGPPGPFTFEMNEEQARAALPGAEWHAPDVPDTVPMQVLMARTPVSVFGIQYMPALEFHEGRLQSIRYAKPEFVSDAAGCAAATQRTVESMEAAWSFNGTRTGDEPDAAAEEMRTPRGSVLRAYPEIGGVSYTYANHRGATFAQVTGGYGMMMVTRAPGEAPQSACMIMLEFTRDPPPPPRAAVVAPTAAELEAAALLTGLRFIEQPDGADFARWYPVEAMRDGVEGRATLDCLVADDGYLRCLIASEEPLGRGFGEAAQQIAVRFRAAPEHEGAPTAGKRVRRTIVFRLG